MPNNRVYMIELKNIREFQMIPKRGLHELDMMGVYGMITWGP